jgi:drug/metabolite transporter (DMT)-like permease
MPPNSSSIPPRARALLAVLTLVWGTNWTLFPLAVQEVSVWTFRSFALLVSGLTLLSVARLRGLSLKIERQDRPTVLAASLAYLVVWNIASTYAAVMIPSGQAAVLGFTMPLWAAVIATLFLGERLTARMMAALALGGTCVGLLLYAGRDA